LQFMFYTFLLCISFHLFPPITPAPEDSKFSPFSFFPFVSTQSPPPQTSYLSGKILLCLFSTLEKELKNPPTSPSSSRFLKQAYHDGSSLHRGPKITSPFPHGSQRCSNLSARQFYVLRPFSPHRIFESQSGRFPLFDYDLFSFSPPPPRTFLPPSPDDPDRRVTYSLSCSFGPDDRRHVFHPETVGQLRNSLSSFFLGFASPFLLAFRYSRIHNLFCGRYSRTFGDGCKCGKNWHYILAYALRLPKQGLVGRPIASSGVKEP